MRSQCVKCGCPDYEIIERFFKTKKKGKIKVGVICSECDHEWIITIYVGDDDGNSDI